MYMQYSFGCAAVGLKNKRSIRVEPSMLNKHFLEYSLNPVNVPVVLIGVEAGFAICDLLNESKIMSDDEYEWLSHIGGTPFGRNRLYINRWKGRDNSIWISVPDNYIRYEKFSIIKIQDELMKQNIHYQIKNRSRCNSAGYSMSSSTSSDIDIKEYEYINSEVNDLNLIGEDLFEDELQSIQKNITSRLISLKRPENKNPEFKTLNSLSKSSYEKDHRKCQV